MGGPGMHRMGPKIDYKAIDTNGDGTISQEELKAWQAKQIDGLDANKDGYLTEQEVVDFETKKAEARIKARVARMFKQLDVNGDGKISAAEMMMAPRDMMADRMFRMADVNHDGKVTQAEFDAAKQKFRKRMERMRAHHGERNWHGEDQSPMRRHMGQANGQMGSQMNTPPAAEGSDEAKTHDNN
ncbi:Ca2+ sensor [Defluviimonas sp. 20V17]|nr:Ca2+ sensor [Defluviimonas sp. 20V17]